MDDEVAFWQPFRLRFMGRFLLPKALPWTLSWQPFGLQARILISSPTGWQDQAHRHAVGVMARTTASNRLMKPSWSIRRPRIG